jgi:hypothetical protein
MLELSVSQSLNHLPHKCVDTPFSIWFNCYQYHIQNLFYIFFNELRDVEPFSDKDINTDNKDFFENFAKMLYKKSTRVV